MTASLFMILGPTLLAAALATGGLTHAAAMSKDAMQAYKKSIVANFEAAEARCKLSKGLDRDVCIASARGHREIAQAELEQRYRPSASNDEKLRLVRADAAFAVAREKCEPYKGDARDVCRKDAKAVQAAAQAQAKLQTPVVQPHGTAVVSGTTAAAVAHAAPRNPALDAQFNAASERCDMLQGEARDGCLVNLRKRFGKP